VTVYFSVYADGSICLDILQNRWSPTYDASAILTSIQVLVCKHIDLHLEFIDEAIFNQLFVCPKCRHTFLW
jgi:hypothetical protein